MIKLTKQTTFTPIYVNQNFIISIEDIQNGSKLYMQQGAIHQVKETALEIMTLIKLEKSVDLVN
jgi:hypothetical protein